MVDVDFAMKGHSLNDLRQISLALLLYSSDNDGYSPYAAKTIHAYGPLVPYTANFAVFVAPRANTKYEVNLNVCGVNLVGLKSESAVPAAYEPKAFMDATHTVGYVDGHARAEAPTAWKRTSTAATRRFLRPAGMKPLSEKYALSLIPADWRAKISAGGDAVPR
jgi:hypothetical protein